MTLKTSLTDVLNRLHSAILGTDTNSSATPGAQKGQEGASKLLQAQTPTARPTDLPEPRIISPIERFASAEAVMVGATLTKGALKLWEFIHAVAVRYAAKKGMSRAASWATFALPQRIVAAALGYTDRHVRRLQGELEQAGLLATHALADEVEGQNLWATTLWAVKLATNEVKPRLTADDYAHKWRDFEADLKRKNTAQAVMSGLKTSEEGNRIFLVFSMVVTGAFTLNTRSQSFRADISPNAVQDAVYRLGSLADMPSPGLVGDLAAAISTGLADGHSFRWWCKRLWAVVGSWERVGALQAQLQRVLADVAEHQGIRNAGAWAVSRVAT